MDDVLGESARMFLSVIEQEFGKRVAYEDMKAFDLRIACGLTSEEVERLFHVAHQPEALLAIAPRTGVREVLDRWVQAGYEIAIVTGRPPATYGTSLEWLAMHELPYHEFVMVDKYGRYSDDGDRVISLDQLSERTFVFAIEDALQMATWLADTMETPVALFDCPWNREHDIHPRITRYTDWTSLGEALS